MSLYSIALFLHVVGALGLFVVLGLEWVSLQQLRPLTTVEEVNRWVQNSSGAGMLGSISMLLILIPGFYMALGFWGRASWYEVAFAVLVLMGVLVSVVTGRRMAAIKRSLATESGDLSSTLHNLLHHPLLWISLRLRVALGLGIVFLMTVKPDLAGSLLVMGVALLLGLASALPVMSRNQTPKLAA